MGFLATLIVEVTAVELECVRQRHHLTEDLLVDHHHDAEQCEQNPLEPTLK